LRSWQPEIGVAAAASQQDGERKDQTKFYRTTHLKRHADGELGAATRPRFERQFALQRFYAALDADRTQPQQLEFFEGKRASERLSFGVVVHRDLQLMIGASRRNRHARRPGMFLDIVERFADDLQNLERQFGVGWIVHFAAGK